MKTLCCSWLLLLSCLHAGLLSEAELTRNLTENLSRLPGLSGKEIRVHALIKKHHLSQLIVSGDYRIEFELPPANKLTSVSYYKFKLSVPGKKTKTYRLKFKTEIFEQVYHALVDLNNKEFVRTDQVGLKKINTLGLSATPLTAGFDFHNKIIQTKIKAGSPLVSWMVAEKPLIRSGDKITLLVIYNEVSLKTPAKALQNGKAGQKIRVQITKSRKIFRALVHEDGTASVSL